MTEFVERFDLFKFLGFPDLPTSHWSIGSGWIMVAYIYDFVTHLSLKNARNTMCTKRTSK